MPFVDYYTPLVKGADNVLNPDYTKDGVHPNLAGYKVMEPIILKAVSKYVK